MLEKKHSYTCNSSQSQNIQQVNTTSVEHVTHLSVHLRYAVARVHEVAHHTERVTLVQVPLQQPSPRRHQAVRPVSCKEAQHENNPVSTEEMKQTHRKRQNRPANIPTCESKARYVHEVCHERRLIERRELAATTSGVILHACATRGKCSGGGPNRGGLVEGKEVEAPCVTRRGTCRGESLSRFEGSGSGELF